MAFAAAVFDGDAGAGGRGDVLLAVADRQAGQGEEQIAVPAVLDAALECQLDGLAEVDDVAGFQADLALVDEAVPRNTPSAYGQPIGELRVFEVETAAQTALHIAEGGPELSGVLENIRSPAAADAVIDG